ncbi:MAG: 16S rRNA (guanine(966)-N(2))-methyltransferase RsmD [Elusimicrobia bacterium]|nr:16S rRNA (guanine(966)-N(2))-methyltransferase RsmD [Elusimicrobiota bacterium]
MRIIAGSLRGRTYKARKDPGVRPISGRIKKSLFDIIRGLLPGSRFLDLFAGTGAVGIEALSRGAGSVVFVDLDKDCVAAIEATVTRMGLGSKARAVFGNALSDLSWLPYRAGLEQFDLIFLGPPYKDLEKRPLAYSGKALARVAQAKLLAPGGWMIAQHHVKEDVPAPVGFERVRREKYGDTFLDFFRPSAATSQAG